MLDKKKRLEELESNVINETRNWCVCVCIFATALSETIAL